MAKFATTKMVEALLVNDTTGARTSQRLDLPYGSVIDDARVEDRYLRFKYLRKTYDVKLADIEGYYHPIGAPEAKAAAKGAEAPAKASGPSGPSLEFKAVESNLAVKRAKVPGGWLVAVGNGVAFVPDTGHKWDGGSL